MLNADASLLAHRTRDLVLITLSFIFLPLDTFLLLVSFLFCHFRGGGPYLRHRRAVRADRTSFRSRTVLVTGVGMTKGLTLARLFHLAGHDVIGADFEPDRALVCGRVSRAVRKFYRLSPPRQQLQPSSEDGTDESAKAAAPYVDSLLDIIRSEKVELWVSCSGVASAVEDGRAKEAVESRTPCRAVQFDAATTRTLHEKASFVRRAAGLGLTVPETREVTSRDQLERFLLSEIDGRRRRKYIVKTVGVDDTVRADMTLLPLPTPAETRAHVSRLSIGPRRPWVVQQFVDGLEFCTHALVVRGAVRAFVACPSAELLMHYAALPSDSVLRRAMLAFTERFARAHGGSFTGHLSFDFLVDRADLPDGSSEKELGEVKLYPIECNPRAHTAVVLFNDTPGLVEAYLSVLDPSSTTTHSSSVIITPAFPDRKYFWTGHDAVVFLTTALFSLSQGVFHADPEKTAMAVVRALDDLLDHLCCWRDGTWVVWDPWPWWWLYHVYWPMRVWGMCVKGRKWSRMNVSTGKMFEC